MTHKELVKRIEAIPGEGGWWKQSSRDEYVKIALQLYENTGSKGEEIIDYLERAYWAAAECYGD